MPSAETGIPTPYNGLEIPCGLDRADGLAGPDGNVRLGTKSESDQIKVTSKKGTGIANLPIEEEADSPYVEMGEQDTIKHRLRMSWDEAVTRGLALRRGVIRTDSSNNYMKLLSCSYQRQPGGKATLETVEECMNGDTPPDRFECVPVELGLHIIKHPRYIDAFLGNPWIPASLATGDTVGGFGSVTEMKNQMVIRLLQDYMENTSAPWRNAILELLFNSLGSESGSGAQPPQFDPTLEVDVDGTTITGNYPGSGKVAGTNMAKAAACEIVVKYWRGEEVPSLVGFQVTWTTYSWTPLPYNPGGYLENPITEGGLPDFLWDTQFPPAHYHAYSSSMFHAVGWFNPQCYSQGGVQESGVSGNAISWRREADQVVRERTFFGTQRRWVGSSIGHWDPQLYTQASRPRIYQNYLPPTINDQKAWTYIPTT